MHTYGQTYVCLLQSARGGSGVNKIATSSHYRKPDVCRVLKALPSARYRALGKDTICRVLTKSHSAKIQHSAKIDFAECLITDTRQTHLCRVPRGQHSAHSLTCAPQTPTASVTHHGRYCLPSARKGTLGKHLFAECHAAGTRQRLSRHAARYRYRLPSARLGHSAKIC